MSGWYTCKVNRAGPASDGTETSTPVIYINLTDEQGSFSGQWFYAADNSRPQMLAIALTAINMQAPVRVALDPPNGAGKPYTEIQRLYVLSP
jgi:hypothetical protein